MFELSISKKKLELWGIILLTFIFIFDGIIKLLDSEGESSKLEIKSKNLQTWLYNNGFIWFTFDRWFTSWYRPMIRILGLVEIAGGAGMLFFEDKEHRNKFVLALFVTTVFDAFMMHLPWVESGK
jgi:hypothetical protein